MTSGRTDGVAGTRQSWAGMLQNPPPAASEAGGGAPSQANTTPPRRGGGAPAAGAARRAVGAGGGVGTPTRCGGRSGAWTGSRRRSLPERVRRVGVGDARAAARDEKGTGPVASDARPEPASDGVGADGRVARAARLRAEHVGELAPELVEERRRAAAPVYLADEAPALCEHLARAGQGRPT